MRWEAVRVSKLQCYTLGVSTKGMGRRHRFHEHMQELSGYGQ